jgi:hypothetical protein
VPGGFHGGCDGGVRLLLGRGTARERKGNFRFQISAVPRKSGQFGVTG